MVHSTTEQTNIVIREAGTGDFEWVVNLMQGALEPFYDGDHRAHAKRIFSAHIEGGYDNIGFFSFEQKMFIAEIAAQRVGVIHVVGKRQQTYKISPLIIAPEFRGRQGVGSVLLQHAETYARSQGARQIYCTVAEKNASAMQFFTRKGFVRAGHSDSHYKVGVVETMLYKPLYDEKNIATFDQPNVSVIPFEERHAEQVGDLIMASLPDSFDGIDGSWLSALYDGHKRRHTADVNAKYKLIFVAVDSESNVVGVAAATPKKGQPIKLMPLIAKDQVAFHALLADLPYQLARYGHKLYIHLNPTADQVMSLQRLGWKIDAAMPSAYKVNVVTQQWSLSIGEETMRTMRVKKRFFDQIRSGKKPLEVRVGYDTINKIQTGERINLSTHMENFVVRVQAVRRYATFEEMLAKEHYKHIVPDSSSMEEVLRVLKSIYPPEKEKLGVVVFEFAQG